jgi:hypothetical protein
MLSPHRLRRTAPGEFYAQITAIITGATTWTPISAKLPSGCGISRAEFEWIAGSYEFSQAVSGRLVRSSSSEVIAHFQWLKDKTWELRLDGEDRVGEGEEKKSEKKKD